MDRKMINQKEYLKKYLSSGKDKKKVKKKKPILGSKTVTIIDDDIDLENMRAIEDGEFDIYNTGEDGPQIAGIVDERGPVDFSDKKRWKIITDDGYGDITVTSVAGNDKLPGESSPRNKDATSNPVRNNSGSQDSDCSPPRKSRKESDYEKPHKSKSSSKKQRRLVSSPVRNRSGSEGSDFSPPRRPRKDSDSEKASKKKSASKKRRTSVSSPVQNGSGSQDSDFSPPRRSRKDSDSEKARKKKSASKKRRSSVSSPVRNRSGSKDSDFSPPRRPRKDSDSDLSPPRNSKPKGRENEQRSREEYSSNSGKKVKSKHDKQRENYSRDSRRRNYDDRNSRTRFSGSPSTEVPDFDLNSSQSKGRNDSHRTGKHASRFNPAEYDKSQHKSRQDRNKFESSRKKDASASPRNRRKADGERRTKNTTHSRKGGNDSDSDLSPPRENKKKARNLNTESSLPEKNTFKNYQEMSAETSGFGQAPVLRDRKTGRRRDLAAEARDKEEKDGKRQELEEKYAQWGRGLKQVEDRQEKLDRDLYEMSKPLARYADDADLERELKAQDREGDPMLAYMRRKHVKEGKQEPEKPRYNGPSMPNRFGIRPGYRWDGVDRSNGYEKKWFEAQNARKAVQEEAYKWSTADM